MRRLVVGLVLLGLLAFGADRVARLAAQDALAAAIQDNQHLDQQPSVQLRGSPFLTQAVSGHYQGGRATVSDFTVHKLRIRSLSVDLTDATVPLGDLVNGRVTQVPVGLVRGNAVITYADLATATGVEGLQIRPKGDELELVVPVTYLGQTVQLIASARVGVQGNALRITSGQVVGVPLPESVTQAAFGGLANGVPLDQLPYGMTVQSIRVTDTGVEVNVLARDALLRPIQR